MNDPRTDADLHPDADLRHLWDEVGPEDAVRVAPPAGLWDAIAAEAGRGSEPDQAAERADVVPPAPVVDLAARRRTVRRWSAAAAAAVGVVAVAAAQLTGSTTREVAAAAITSDGLPLAVDGDASAVIVDDDGRYVLELSVPPMPDPQGGAWEVWVIDTDVADMHSLGTLDGGRLALPEGVEPADFPIVDISFEPADGDPAHSGQSILRGRLEF